MHRAVTPSLSRNATGSNRTGVQIVNNRQREVLDLQLAGQHDMANARLNLLNDLQGTVQDQRALVKSKMAAWSVLPPKPRNGSGVYFG